MNSQIDRRDFLGVGAAGLTLALIFSEDSFAFAGEMESVSPFAPSVWLTISVDGTITIVSPASELGQGTSTTLPAVLADELDAEWSMVKVITPPGWDEAKD